MTYSVKENISILLPYKEDFNKRKAGAVSLYVSELSRSSRYKNNIYVFGEKFKGKHLSNNFIGTEIGYDLISSKTKRYLDNYLLYLKNSKIKLIEIHNRPNYFHYLRKKTKIKINFFFHNDPLSMKGSETAELRREMLDGCEKIIFNSVFTKKCFFDGLNEKLYIDKYDIIYNSTNKIKKFPKKQKLITFVGKLNHSKGYDLFTKAIKKILDKFPDYKAIAIGDEKRKKIFFQHKNFKELGFLTYNKTISYLLKTDIATIPSIWNEPFGRTSMEASRCGCYTIVSNVGGLKETSDNIILINNITEQKIYNEIKYAIENKNLKKNLQKKALKNVKHLVSENTSKLDNIRKNIFLDESKSLNKKRIINIYNHGAKLNHRLFNISIGKKISSGFTRNGYDVIDISDRDFEEGSRFNKVKKFQNYIFETLNNYLPKILIFAHCRLIDVNFLKKIKESYPNIILIEWNEDYLGLEGPDSRKNYKSLKLKEKFIDYYFITTNPNKIIGKLKNSYFFLVPVDKNIENLKQFEKNNKFDIFFALSHGVNRGVLKKGKEDEREKILKKIKENKNINSNFFGFNNKEPIWASNYNQELAKCSMGLNLSRGKPIDLYSSNRIASYIGNGLLTFIDYRTGLQKIFNKNEAVYYKSTEDLIKKIIFFKKNDKIRKRIAKNGYIKYHKLYNSQSLSKKILNVVYNSKK